MSNDVENLPDEVQTVNHPIFMRLFKFVNKSFKKRGRFSPDIVSWMTHFFCEVLKHPKIFLIISDLKAVAESLVRVHQIFEDFHDQNIDL